MTTVQKVADSIDKLMFDQGKRNKDLAELLKVTPTQASMIRRGLSQLNTNDLFIVAHWLNVGADDLARGYALTSLAS